MRTETNRSVFHRVGYMVAVLLPGIVLAVLMLARMRGHNAVLEDTLRNSAEDAAGRILATLDAVLDETISELEMAVSLMDRVGNIDHEARDWSEGLMVFDAEGDLLYPVFPFRQNVRLFHDSSEMETREFLKTYADIESIEARGKVDLAAGQYGRMLETFTSPAQQAIILNAMSRCYVKLDRTEDAIFGYNEMIRSYAGQVDSDGRSLGAVAFMELVDIYQRSGNEAQAVETLTRFLNELVAGDIRCSESEGMFIAQWLEDHVTVAREAGEKGRAPAGFSEALERLHVFSERLAMLETVMHVRNAIPEAKSCSASCSCAPVDDGVVVLRNLPQNGGTVACVVSFELLGERVDKAVAGVAEKDIAVDYEARDQNGDMVFASVSGGIDQPTITRLLNWALPGWVMLVKSTASEGMRRGVLLKSVADMALTLLLLVVMVSSATAMGRAMLRERELSRMKTEFVSSVSHEMRTPLTTMRMVAEMIHDGKVKDDAMKNEYHELLLGETDRLTRLVNKVLDFSRMDSGRQPYEFREVDVGEVIRSTLRVFEPLASEKGFAVDAVIDEDLPVLAMDSDAVSQVLLNILDNALKYSLDDHRIELKASRRDGGVVVEISDHGIGIARDELDTVFERFYRCSNKLTLQTPGSGIGLSIVRYIMDAHAGEIKVHSEPGKGSTFTLVFQTAGK